MPDDKPDPIECRECPKCKHLSLVPYFWRWFGVRNAPWSDLWYCFVCHARANLVRGRVWFAERWFRQEKEWKR
jgi:hypothetical protein